MPLNILESILAGTGLFLFGIRLVSDGIRKVAQEHIKQKISRLVSNPLVSFLIGLLTAFLLQSASLPLILVSVMLSGGALTVYQAIWISAGVLPGVGFGLVFDLLPYNFIAAPLVLAGFIVKFFVRKRIVASFGDLVLGSGLFAMGLKILETGVVGNGSTMVGILVSEGLFQEPLKAFCSGAILAVVLQSMDLVEKLASALVSDQSVPARMIIPIAMGSTMAAALTGLFASVSGTSVSRRFFFVYTGAAAVSVSALSSLIWLLPENSAAALSGGVQEFTHIPKQFAAVMSMSGFLMVVIFAAASRRIAARVVSEDLSGMYSAGQPRASYLDERIIPTPIIALEQARKELSRMYAVASDMTGNLKELLNEFDKRRTAKIMADEEVLDALNHEITAFLARVASADSGGAVSGNIPVMLQTVSDLEHLGDRCMELLKLLERKKECGTLFSEEAMDDLKLLVSSVDRLMDRVVSCNRDSIPVLQQSELKIQARRIFGDVLKKHGDRLCSGKCSPPSALLFNEMTSTISRMNDLLFNIMETMERTF